MSANDSIALAEERLKQIQRENDPTGSIALAENRLRDISPITQQDPKYAQYLEIAEGAREHPQIGKKIAEDYGLRNDYRANKVINRPQQLLISEQQRMAAAGEEIEAGEAYDEDISALSLIPTADAAKEVRQTLDISNAIESLQSGEKLSQQDTKAHVRTIDEYMLRQARESRGRTVGASIAEGVSKVPAFMLEFWLAGPAAGLVKKGMSKASLSAMRKYSSSQLRKSLLKSTTGKLANRAIRGGISKASRGLSWGAQEWPALSQGNSLPTWK